MSASLETFNALTPVALVTALSQGRDAGILSAQKNRNMDMIWPCGFAWITLKVRKNHKLAKFLKNFGFSWNDYGKSYQYRGHDISHAQNMDYRVQFLNDMNEVLRANGIPSYVDNRID